MNNIKVTRTLIPLASELIGKEWGNPVYAIDTTDKQEGLTQSEYAIRHTDMVNAEISKITSEYSQSNHSSVSLREVKSELKYADFHFWNRLLTLVEFRVRDSY